MRRCVHTAIAIVLLLGMMPGSAFAWCNGPVVNGSRGAGYGSHDWILDQAIKQAGASGDWVHRKTALLTTDDPDTHNWSIPAQHFYVDGSCRGAAQTVADVYHKAVLAYQAGDGALASKYLGELSHCYTDILQPFHTTAKAKKYHSLHIKYEYAADDHQNTSTKSRSWLTLRPVELVSDIRQKTVDAAVYARSQFPTLVKDYNARRRMSGDTLRVTKRVMSRGVNDLADIIKSIPLAAGEATAPATWEMDISRTSVPRYQSALASIRLTGANGQPLDAVGVSFVWRLPGDRKITWKTYTDANGYVSRHQEIGSTPTGDASVTMKFTVNGVSTTQVRDFQVTRKR